jgi:uracil-DNA glycosylase family 4
MQAKYVPGAGSSAAKLMIVGEAPGKHEEEQGEPFVGPSGALVNEMLREAGVHRNEVYVTNVFKYRPPNNKFEYHEKTGHTVEEGLPQLWEEIDAIKPNAILALGGIPLHYLCGKGTAKRVKKTGALKVNAGITKWRGSILEAKSSPNRRLQKVIPAIHPANFLEQRGSEGVFKYSARYYTQLDFNRAVEESRTPDLNLPIRTLQIVRDSVTLRQILFSKKNVKKIAIDIEVMRSMPTCLGIAFSKSYAISVPLVNIPGAKEWIPIEMHELALMWRMLAEFLEQPDLQIIGQNFKFDEQKILKPLGIRLPRLWVDTMLLSHNCHSEFPKNLGFLTSIYTREPFYKDEGKEFNPKKDNPRILYTYNARDCAVDYEICDELLSQAREIGIEDFFFNFTMPLNQLYMEIETVGFEVDEPRRKELWKKYDDLDNAMGEELDRLAGYHVRNLAKKEVSLLLFEKFKLPFRDSTEEDILVALMCNHGKNPDAVRACDLVINRRRVKKVKSTYLSAKCDYDGKLRCTYNEVGTETGRTSTSKQGPPVRPEPLGIPYHVMSKHGEFGGDLRTMLKPTKGMWFGEADESQAEARIVALLSRDKDTLEMFGRLDIHAVTAANCFGIDVNMLTPKQWKEDPRRFIGKTTRHAGNYGMQKGRLMNLIQTDARRFHIEVPPISEWKAGEILRKFHLMMPKIQGVFHVEIQEALQNNGRVLISPFGRYRMFFDRWSDALFREAYAYIPQSTVSDHLKHAMLRIKKRLPWLQIVVEAHDAVVWQCYPEQFNDVAAVVKEEMERPIDFERCTLAREPIIIPADVKVGRENYKDLVDYKVAA